MSKNGPILRALDLPTTYAITHAEDNGIDAELARLRDALDGALQAAAAGYGLDAVSVCVDDALDALYALTGENASDAVIDEVFARFCVGK